MIRPADPPAPDEAPATTTQPEASAG
jgi:hypothetical protein